MADFSDLMRKAAEAKAAMDALGKSGTDANNNMAASEQKLVDVRKQQLQILKDESAAARTTADSYKQYNQQALYGGRSDMQSHLGDMERELQYETMLNRQRWLGFTTPQQAYAWRQNEYQQRLLMNRAEWGGYATADQYVAYLQKESAAWKDMNAAMLQRAALYKQNTDAALAYYNAVQGSHRTTGALTGDNLSGVTALNDALTGLPDQVSTQVSVDTSQAVASVTAYQNLLASIPQTVVTDVVGSNGGSLPAPGAATQVETVTVNDQASSTLEKIHRELNQMPEKVEITADFNDAKAMAAAESFYAFLSQHRNVSTTETLNTLTKTGAAGGGGGPPPPAGTAGAADDEPNPNDVNAAAAAENALAKALITEHLAAQGAAAGTHDMAMSTAEAEVRARNAIADLLRLADASNDSGDKAKYAYAAQIMQAAAAKAVGSAAIGTVAQLAEQAAGARDAGEASSLAYVAQQQLKEVLQGIDSPAMAAKAALEAAGSGAESSGNSARRAYGYWGLLSKEVTLWAGLLGDTHMIGMVQLWHILMDGVIEVLALWIPALAAAAIGLTAWGIAGFNAGEKIAKQMYNVYQVSTALNESVAPLKRGFSELQQIVQPQVYELFGDALTVLNHQGGAFNVIVQETGAYLEKLGAKIAIMLTSGGNGLLNFFQTGAKDLAIIGKGFDSLFVIFGALIKATALTHIAEDLAMVGDEVLKFVSLIAKIPTPLLAGILALHGIILWGGLAVDILAKVAIGFAGVLGKIGPLNDAMFVLAQRLGASDEKLQKLAQNAPALQGMSGALGTSSKEAAAFQVNAAKLGTSLDELALGTQAGRDMFAKYGADLDETGQKAVKLAIATQGTEQAVSQVALSFGSVGRGAGEAEEGLKAAGTAAEDTAEASGGLLSKLGGIATKLPVVGGLFSGLAEIPVLGWVAALALALAGVFTWLALLPDPTQKWINSLNQAVAKASVYQVLGTTVQTLAAATTALSNAQQKGIGNAAELAGAQQQLSGQLSAELDHIGSVQKAYGVSMPEALDIMNTAGVKTSQLFSTQAGVWAQAAQQVKGLILGYQAMGQQIGEIGGDLNVLMVTESNQLKSMGTLNTAWDNWTKIVGGSASAFLSLAAQVAGFDKASKATGASMTGLGTNAIALQNAFQSAYGGVETLFDAFRSQQAITGQGDFTAFVKDAAAELIPMAKNSAAAQAQVMALAREGGFTGTTMQQLTKWVGNVKDPMEAMYKATNKETVAASNLSKEAQDLSNSLQQILNPALANAQFAAEGGQKTLTDFATALMHTGANSQQTAVAGKAAVTELLAIDKNAGQAKATFVGWAESMGLSQKAADQLWAKFTTGKGKVDEQSQSVQKLRGELGKAYDSQKQLAKPGEWDTILKSFKDGTFYELTFLAWIPQVQRVLEVVNHAVGQFFAHDIPHAFGVTVNAFESAWDGMVNWFTQSVPHALEVAWGGVSSFFDTAFTHVIPALWNDAWSGAVTPVAHAFDDVKHFITSSFDTWWKTHGSAIETIWDTTLDVIKTSAVDVFNAVVHAAQSFWSFLTGIFTSGPAKEIWNILANAGINAWALIKGSALDVWRVIYDTAKSTWQEITGIAKAAWDIVAGLAKVAWDVLTDFLVADFKSAGSAIEGIFKAVWDIVVGLAKIAWDAIVLIINEVLDLLSGHWATAWKDMQNFATQVWNQIKTVGGQVWNAISTAGTEMWNNLWGATKTAALQAWNAIKSGAQQTWNAIWHSMDSSFIQPVGGFFTKTVPGYWNSFTSRAASTWTSVWGSFKNTILNPMGNWFSNTLPNAIQGAFKNSINWVISNVINRVIGDINAVTKVVGIPAIPTVPGLASGGMPYAKIRGSVPGPADSDNVLAHVMGGEYVIRQPARMALEAKHGRGFMDYLNQYDTVAGSGSRGILASQQRHAAGGPVGSYASGGGILGSVEGFLSNIGGDLTAGASSLTGLVEGGASALKGLISKGAQAVFNGVWDGSIGTLLNLVPEGNLPGDLTHYIGAEIKNGMDTILGAKDKAAQAKVAAGTLVSYSKNAGVTQWEPDVLKVLAMLGLPASDLPTVMSQMETESGGNPNAINLVDSNAAAGDPSKGLMQVIATTFAAYRNPSLSANIYDPMANIYAGLNYAIHRYGNPGWLSVLGHGHGYAAGGMVMPPLMLAAGGPTPAQSTAWASSAAKMLTGWRAFLPSFDSLTAQKQPSGVSAADWAAWEAQLGTGKTAESLLAHDLSVFNTPLSAAGEASGSVFGAMTGAGGTPLLAKALAAKAPGAAAAANAKLASTLFNTFSVELRDAQAAERIVQVAKQAAATTTGSGGTTGTGTGTGTTGTDPTTGTGTTAASGATAAQVAAWKADAAKMLVAWRAFLPQYNALGKEARPSGTSAAVWNAWGADLAISDKAEQLLAKDLAVFNNPSDTPMVGSVFGAMTAPGGTQVLAEVLAGHQPAQSYWTSSVKPSAEAATSKFPSQLLKAATLFRTFSADLRTAQDAERLVQVANVSAGTSGSGGTTTAPPVTPIVPGIIGAPPATTATPVNLSGYATMGGPSSGVIGSNGTQGFAAGGGISLGQVASMFAGGLPMGGGMTLPVQMPASQIGQLRKTQELPRTMGAAAAGTGNRVGLNVENITVNNPVPEPPSTSITRAADRLSFLAGRGPV